MVDQTCFDAVFASPVGRLGICVQGKTLSQLEFLSGQYRLRPAQCAECSRVQQSILGYFDNPYGSLEVDVQLLGTLFQRKVWRALRLIPAGKVMTYGALAERLGTSARAVGNACRRNPVPIVIPCHRVVAQHGPGGFAGDRQGRLVRVKQWLLQAEGVEIRN
ncbi:MAG: methylated-DNA--[protein]-cysteine S-methyltransferase [Gammaproteobacteria bacterium]|nr:MAG: methylated-DNA--[protein]-cysteine S-methyltransferase [Gammaproteobacteria bacterium]